MSLTLTLYTTGTVKTQPFFARRQPVARLRACELILSARAAGERLLAGARRFVPAGIDSIRRFCPALDDTCRRGGVMGTRSAGGKGGCRCRHPDLGGFRLLYPSGPGLRGWDRLCLGSLGPEFGIRLVPGPADFCERIFDYEDYWKTVPFLIPKMRKGVRRGG